MTEFRGYTHVERLSKDVVKDILRGEVSVTPKQDGTNACVWSDGERIFAGSRTRFLAPGEDDNAGFREYVTESEDAEVAALRDFARANPSCIVYGEWLGGVDGRKLTGSIKQYLDGGFWVFDVYDRAAEDYLPHNKWFSMLHPVYHRCVPELAHGRLTVERLDGLVESNRFNLPENIVGEGIVIKGEPSYRDAYGHVQIAKIVREEFKASKAKPKKVYGEGELEDEFVDTYMTAAFVDKELNKIRLSLGLDEVDNKNGKLIGYAMSSIPNVCVEENIVEFIKKRKNPTLDFGRIVGESKNVIRDFLGL